MAAPLEVARHGRRKKRRLSIAARYARSATTGVVGLFEFATADTRAHIAPSSSSAQTRREGSKRTLAESGERALLAFQPGLSRDVAHWDLDGDVNQGLAAGSFVPKPIPGIR